MSRRQRRSTRDEEQVREGSSVEVAKQGITRWTLVNEKMTATLSKIWTWRQVWRRWLRGSGGVCDCILTQTVV